MRAAGCRLRAARGTLRAIIVIAALLCIATGKLVAQTELVIVGGLGGEAKYSATFARLGGTLAKAAHQRWGIPDSSITWLVEDSASKSPWTRGVSTKANVVTAVERAARRTSNSGQVVLVFIGHGSGEGLDSRISLPGPDLTAAELRSLLARWPAHRIAVIDLTSASGDLLPLISATGRVVVTATKSSFERNESRFGEYFVAALSGDGADVDKDGRVSLLEAFRYATAETKRFYDTESRLATEHAQLDDNGDGTGSADPTGRSGDGMLARRFFLAAGPAARTGTSSSQLESLYNEQDRRRDAIDALKVRKAAMPVETYEVALEKLLVEFAVAARAIRAAEGVK